MRPFTRVLTAGADSDIPARGNFIFVQAANLPIVLRAERREIGAKEGGGNDVEVQLSNRQKMRTRLDFDHIKIRNPNASSVTVTLIIGYGDFDAPLSTISTGGNNTLADVADVTLGAAATSIIAADANRTKVHIKALATNTQNVRIGSGTVTATRGAQLQPGEGLTLETSAEVFGIREAAGTVDVTVTAERNT